MKRVVLFLLLFGAWQSVAAKESPLVNIGSEWRYFDGSQAPYSQWNTVDFDDSDWSIGKAQFGYGEGDEVTETSFGEQANAKPIAQFFRHYFIVDSLPSEPLTLNLLVDDGAIIFINGQEAYRANLPAQYHVSAQATGTFIEHVWLSVPLDARLVKLGENVIAVAVHQLSPSSTDISFDLGLFY